MSPRAPRAPLRAGAAVVDITPKRTGIRPGGHAVNRRATGVLDPLKARALHVETDDSQVTLVVLDLIGLQKIQVDRIRHEVREPDPESILSETAGRLIERLET